jgi:deazaflavin-dependent oxidoreductase (nitroreductase family)
MQSDLACGVSAPTRRGEPQIAWISEEKSPTIRGQEEGMARNRVKRVFLWILKNTLNRAALRAARSGRGPFSLVRHVGRKTGRSYETPLILARVRGGFIAELTYGPDVAWYRNVVAAGECVILVKGVEYRIDRIEPCDTAAGLRSFGNPAALVLRLLRRHEFRFLHEAKAEAEAGGESGAG